MIEQEVSWWRHRRAAKRDRERLTETRAERQPRVTRDQATAARSREAKLARPKLKRLRIESHVATERDRLTLGVEFDDVRAYLDGPRIRRGARRRSRDDQKRDKKRDFAT